MGYKEYLLYQSQLPGLPLLGDSDVYGVKKNLVDILIRKEYHTLDIESIRNYHKLLQFVSSVIEKEKIIIHPYGNHNEPGYLLEVINPGNKIYEISNIKNHQKGTVSYLPYIGGEYIYNYNEYDPEAFWGAEFILDEVVNDYGISLFQNNGANIKIIENNTERKIIYTDFGGPIAEILNENNDFEYEAIELKGSDETQASDIHTKDILKTYQMKDGVWSEEVRPLYEETIDSWKESLLRYG